MKFGDLVLGKLRKEIIENDGIDKEFYKRIAIILIKWKIDERLKEFNWEKFYRQLEHSNPYVSSTTHQTLYKEIDILGFVDESDRRDIVIFILENIDEIMWVLRNKSNVRQITEPWLVSMDQ